MPKDPPIADPAHFILRFLAGLPVSAAQAAAAFASTTSHAVVHRQVLGAHRIAGLAHQHAEFMAEAGRVFPAGPLRAAAASAVRLQAGLIDAWLETANGYGRAFARKAFAFPVSPAFQD